MSDYEVVKRPTTKRAASRFDEIAERALQTATTGQAISVPLREGETKLASQLAIGYRIKKLGYRPRFRFDKPKNSIVVWAEKNGHDPK